MSLLSN